MKKILTLLLAALLTFSCFACNKTPEVNNPQNPNENTTPVDPYANDLFVAKYNTNETADVEIDFSTADTSIVQNLLKFDMFTPNGYHMKDGAHRQDAFEQFEYLSALKAESYRVDTCADRSWGTGYTKEINENDWTDVNVTLERFFAFADELYDVGVNPYFILLGNPAYTWNYGDNGNGGQEKKSVNYEQYTDYMKKLSKAFADSGRRVTFETWNEPDLGTQYWQYGMKSFVDMSVQGTAALKQGNPDATVAELALCYPNKFCNEYNNTLNGTLFDYYMTQNKLYGNTPDYLSWHYYADAMGEMDNGVGIENFAKTKEYVRTALNKYIDDTHTTSQHITEYHPVGQQASKALQKGCLPMIINGIDHALNATDISRVSWVCYFVDWGYALIDSNTYEKNATYFVLSSYARMPQTPATVNFLKEMKDEKEDFKTYQKIKYDTFTVKTGVDSSRASAIIVNNVLNPIIYSASEYVQRLEDSRLVNVKLKNIPFDAKSLDVYLIDNEHSKDRKTTSMPYQILDLNTADLVDGDVTMTLKIPGNSAFYIELNDSTGLGERDVNSNLDSHVLKKTYYYDQRADLMPYSDIHENSYSVALGMLNNATGKTAICVTMDKMNEFNSVQANWNIFGNASSTGSTGVRVDFHTNSGYTYSKTYYYGSEKGFTFSGFGTGAETNGYVKMGTDSKFSYNINLASDAPTGWDGKIQMTYFMQDMGVNVGARVTCKGI